MPRTLADLRAPAILALGLLLGSPALAQQPAQTAAPPPPPPQNQEQAARGAGASQQDQQPQPSATGERSGNAGASTTGTLNLSQALVATWGQAVDLDGKPLQEASQLAVPGGKGPPPK